MRFLTLLAFGGMGGLVMWLGWVRYRKAAGEARTWPWAEAAVRQAMEEGYAALCQVGGETYLATGGKWFGWPNVKDGENVAVLYDPGTPGAGKVKAWQEWYREAVLPANLPLTEAPRYE